MTLPGGGNSEFPPLPPPANGEWPEVVERWYVTWATSPQATTFLATDWQRLHMLAYQVLDYYRTLDRGILAEIRLNEASLGATVVDRRRLGWDVSADSVTAPDSTTAAKRPSTGARARLRAVDTG